MNLKRILCSTAAAVAIVALVEAAPAAALI